LAICFVLTCFQFRQKASQIDLIHDTVFSIQCGFLFIMQISHAFCQGGKYLKEDSSHDKFVPRWFFRAKLWKQSWRLLWIRCIQNTQDWHSNKPLDTMP